MISLKFRARDYCKRNLKKRRMQHNFTLLLVATILFCIANVNAQSNTDCTTFLNNTQVAFLSVFDGNTEVGNTKFFSNGTISVFISGFLVTEGTYTVEDGGNGWCYLYESFGPTLSNCNTFSICTETNSVIGCGVDGDTCIKACETELQWSNWFSARINGTAESN